jgi:hypothetical protein
MKLEYEVRIFTVTRQLLAVHHTFARNEIDAIARVKSQWPHFPGNAIYSAKGTAREPVQGTESEKV